MQGSLFQSSRDTCAIRVACCLRSPYPADMATDFSALGLKPELLASLAKAGWSTPTTIQQRSIPPALEGRDLVGQAETGSGKTGAFGLPILQTIDPSLSVVQALVLCPTRELAQQVAEALRVMGARIPNLRVLTTCGGHPVRDQQRALTNGGHIVVGTPGRLNHLLRTGHLLLDSVGALVLDEADRMLDMGFAEQVSSIVQQTPAGRQTLLFSATFPEGVTELSSQTQSNPLRISTQSAPLDAISQSVIHTDRSDRLPLIARLLSEEAPSRALVFCETRSDCARVAEFLRHHGASAAALHGELTQRERDEAILRFMGESLRVLAATDVAARGLDVPALPMVIISEPSRSPEVHVHRVGRTGRAGEQGEAITIVTSTVEDQRLQDIEAFCGIEIPLRHPPSVSTDLDHLQAPFRTLLILSGRRDRIRKGDVLGALVREAALPPDAVGQIELRENICAVSIRPMYARQAERALARGRIKGRRVRALLLRK